MAGDSFFTELRKRRVFRAAAIYGAVAWGLTEVIVTIVEQLYLPAWVATLSVIVFVVGFPVAMFLAWTFDITASGIQRTEISSRRGAVSIAGSMLLLVLGTGGLFLLIRPAMEQADRDISDAALVPNSIAVLPFENVSRREDDFYLSEGLSDELRDQLGRVQGLQIAARSSSIAARNQAVGATKMAASLGVAYLVEGSLRRNGPRLGISVQLIDGRTGLAAWSGNYERGRLELLDVQQEVAREVVAMVLPGSAGLDSAPPATLNASANDFLLLARREMNLVRSRQEVDTGRLLKAIDLYREATRADPNSALAHSRLASALLYLGDIEAAETAVQTALSLDPMLSEVQNTLGEYYWALGRPQAGAAFEKAVELNPNDVDALQNLAHVRWMTQSNKESGDGAEELFRRAVQLDPLTLSRHAALGEYLGQAAHWDAVRAVIGDIQGLFDSPDSYRAIGWLYELIGEIDYAIAWTLKARQIEPENPDHDDKLADLFATIGDFETADRLAPSPGIGLLYRMRRYEQLIEMAELLMIDKPDSMEIRYVLAFAYGATGAFESAIRVLGSTGLPDSVLEDRARSVMEFEGFHTLMDVLVGSGIPEAVEAGRALAQWNENSYWYGDIGAIALARGCTRALLGQREAALEVLARMPESPRLQPLAGLLDLSCFEDYKDEPVYQEVLRDQHMKRAALRERLPETLEEFGLSPP